MAIADILDAGFFRPRNLVPAVLAIIVGIVAWFGIRPALSGGDEEPTVIEAPTPGPAATPAPAPEPEPVYPFVLVAERPIQSGVLIVADLVEWLQWRDAIDMDVAVVRDAVPLQALLGAVTMRPFEEGELLAWDGLILPGTPGFITAVLARGHRAVTVEVDRATTSANIIFPGDRVDVILVANAEAGGTTDGSSPAAQSIVDDVRVLAVGSTIMSLRRYGKASLATPGVVEAVTAPPGETYTLEVTPKDAERIALAAGTGRLTLAVRSIFTLPGTREDPTPVRFGEIMRPPDTPAEPPQVRVIRGGADEETVTGGGRVTALFRCVVTAAVAMSAMAAVGAADHTIELSPGTSKTLSFETDIGTAFVANPETADVEILDNRRVFVLGRAHGFTSLDVHGASGELLGAYAVRVQVQSTYARAVVSKLAGEQGRIEVESVGDALFVSGTAEDPSQAERVLRGIRAVSGETPVVDALSLETPAQVNLEVLISEVSRNVTQQLGVDWSIDLNPFTNPLQTWVTGTGVRLATGALTVDESLHQAVQFFPVLPDGTIAREPQFVNEVSELAVAAPVAPRGGDGSVVLSHTKELNSGKYRASAFLEALAENGLAVVHARPNLTAVSGQPAEFFSGLEIPVPTITDRGTIGTEYRETGVSLTFTPTVLDRDHISLVVQPRIREIAAGGATIAGTVVPNINERSVSTTVELGDGESIAIAGLYRRSTTATEAGVPLLQDIPLWGALFRQTREAEDSVELIIVVTPRIVAPVQASTLSAADEDPAKLAVQLDNEFYY